MGLGKGKTIEPGGRAGAEALASAVAAAGGAGRLIPIKQELESGDEDELESEEFLDDDDGDLNLANGDSGTDGRRSHFMHPLPALNLTVRETIRRLAQLLAENASEMETNGDSDGAG
jgi:hypothetical protein